jgi:hypothetical protein
VGTESIHFESNEKDGETQRIISKPEMQDGSLYEIAACRLPNLCASTAAGARQGRAGTRLLAARQSCLSVVDREELS